MMLELCFTDDFYYANETTDGILFFKDGANCFPDCDWIDFPIGVLSMWCMNLNNVFQTATANFELCFMDGPFFVRCNKQKDSVHMRFVEDRNREIIRMEHTLSFIRLAQMVYQICTALFEALEKHKLGKLTGLRALSESAETLKRNLRAYEGVN